jgi:glycosyltransferase involved in cell wall biosynthesis
VVDDGSSDDTGAIAERLGAKVLRHEKNLGKGAGIHDCFEYAKRSGADVLITLDGDGQHDPSLIPRLLETLEKTQADVVIGSRTSRPSDMPGYRWTGERALDLVTGVKVDGRLVDSQSGFRAYSRKAIENLSAAEYGMGVDAQLIKHANEVGMKITEVSIAMNYGISNTSTHNPLMHGLDVIFSLIKFVSIRHPLLFYGTFAVCFLSVSTVFGFMTIDSYQRYGRVITNLALVSIASGIIGFLSLFTAIILFTLITVVREKR